jgi:CheY-like chemotaxis protein
LTKPHPIKYAKQKMARGSLVADRFNGFVKQILLIEDNAGDILLIKQVLSQATFAIALRVAMDGEQALQVLADSEFKPNLTILDLRIPKISGLEILARCKPTAPSWFSAPHHVQ